MTYRWLFWCLALVGLAVDQGSKYGVFYWLHVHPEESALLTGKSAAIIPGAFALETKFTRETFQGEGWKQTLRTLSGPSVPVVNRGALWGIGGRNERDEPGTDMNHVFSFISVAAALAIIGWSFRKKSAHEGLLCVALGLILAGTLGNLYDRVVFDGVRDFLHWNRWFDWPVFNIADCCLVCGAGLLLLQAFFTAPAEKQEQSPSAAGSEPMSSPSPAVESEVA